MFVITLPAMPSLLCSFFNLSLRFLFSSNKALQSTLSHDVVITPLSWLSISSSLTTSEVISFLADDAVIGDKSPMQVFLVCVVSFASYFEVSSWLLTRNVVLGVWFRKAGKLRGLMLSSPWWSISVGWCGLSVWRSGCVELLAARGNGGIHWVQFKVQDGRQLWIL